VSGSVCVCVCVSACGLLWCFSPLFALLLCCSLIHWLCFFFGLALWQVTWIDLEKRWDLKGVNFSHEYSRAVFCPAPKGDTGQTKRLFDGRNGWRRDREKERWRRMRSEIGPLECVCVCVCVCVCLPVSAGAPLIPADFPRVWALVTFAHFCFAHSFASSHHSRLHPCHHFRQYRASVQQRRCSLPLCPLHDPSLFSFGVFHAFGRVRLCCLHTGVLAVRDPQLTACFT
jgi:hypothetical protein